MKGSESCDTSGVGKPTFVIILAALCLVSLAVTGAAGSAPKTNYPVRFELPPATAVAAFSHVPPGDANGADGAMMATAATKPRAVTASPVAGRAPELFDTVFDNTAPLAGQGSLSGPHFSLVKRLLVNGAESGTARVMVDERSQVFVASSDLAVLAGSTDNEAGGPAFLSFEQLRERGLRVRYDPVSDAIEIVK